MSHKTPPPRKRQRNSEQSAKRKPRGPGRRFPPGKSGNPKGRPPLPEDYKTFLSDRLGPKGLAALEAILDNPRHPRHEQCAEYVINRWKGTPTVKTEIAGPDGGPIAVKTVMTSDEKRARVASLIATARARARAGHTGEDDPGGSD